MKTIFIMALGLLISLSTIAATPKHMICHDTEFGAVHFKLIITDMKGFFYPQDQKSPVKANFWIKGEAFTGMIDSPVFLPDWNPNMGWYKNTPSPLDFSLCNWTKCPVRKIKLMVFTKDQLKAEGNIKFIHQTSDNERVLFDRRLNCELR